MLKKNIVKKINKYMVSYKIKKFFPKIKKVFCNIILAIITMLVMIILPIVFSYSIPKEDVENMVYSISSIIVFINFYNFLQNNK